MPWKKVAETIEIPENKGKEVEVNGNRIAIFHANGRYYAIEALCRHQDGSLAPGKINGEVVECPLHFWHYNIRTGELLDYLKDVKLETYTLDIRGNDIFIDI
ncbi:MAG TPA: Rieske 2Fe-2S domain-containing protein [Nitrososphaeraceae archaeon]|jgi:nitrite reductase (NADH) small subunit|nr:Rieske 2Fe-2S domain-containing protein [Nitrososphaeraceae archaeon]